MFFSKLFKKRKDRLETSPEPLDTKNAGIASESNTAALMEDEELVAVITAAIQASLGYEVHNKLVIKSITRTGQSSPIWNRTGRLERLAKKL